MLTDLSGLNMLLRMNPRTHSIINLYTIDPNVLRRSPAYTRNGKSSDMHVLQLKDMEGRTSNACVLFYGKVEACNLRRPTRIDHNRFLLHRGIIITAYKAFFKRFLALYAHVTGHQETFIFPYGCFHVALTQMPMSPSDTEEHTEEHTESNSESGSVSSADYDLTNANDTVGMRLPPFYQDPSSLEEFSFGFRNKTLFNDRGKHDIFILVYLF